MSSALLAERPESSPSPHPEHSADLLHEVAQVCKMLSDPTRLRILVYLLEENELNVTELCERLEQSQPAVSHHLALLRVSGLLETRRAGKHNFYSVSKPFFRLILQQLFDSFGEGEELRFDKFVIRQA